MENLPKYILSTDWRPGNLLTTLVILCTPVILGSQGGNPKSTRVFYIRGHTRRPGSYNPELGKKIR